MTDLAVEFAKVSKRYPYFHLSDIDLNLEKGQVVGLIGQNGAGKSTSLRILLGLVKPDTGRVRVLGHPIPEAQLAAKRQLAYLSEDLRLYKAATLKWHLDFLQKIFPSWDTTYARHLVQKFQLNLDQKLKGFSHGQRVKAGLLLALARRPKLLILDEPTTGLDPIAKSDVLGEMMDVLAEEDRTILFSSHTTQDVEQLSDHIVFMDQGRILDSADKECFLEKWRRIQLTAQSDVPFAPAWLVKGSGHLKTLVTHRFHQDMVKELEHQGHQIHSVSPMTLEEIFIAQVAMGRKEAAA